MAAPRHLTGKRAAALEADLRALGPGWWGVAVRFFYATKDVPPGSLLGWSGPGFYMRPSAEEAWRLIGPDIMRARAFYRGKRREAEHRPPPPTGREVAGVVWEVVQFITPMATDVLLQKLKRNGGPDAGPR